MDTERLAYSVRTFAKLTELSVRFVKQEIYDGKLKAIKKGSRVVIPVEAARDYLAIEKETREQEESLATAA